jgi:hypothetical protein
MTPKNIAPPALVKEANQAKTLFCDSWAINKNSTLEIGRAIVWLEEKCLHKYIPKPGSRKGYPSLEEAVSDWTAGECGPTKMYDCKRIYLLTQGEHAIPAEVVTKMPKRNQLQVSRVRKALSPAPVPEKLIKQAVSEPILKFAETAQEAINATKPPEKRKEPLTDVVVRGVHVRVANAFYELMDDLQKLPIVRDGDRTLNLESKALQAIVTSARCWCQEIINQQKAKENAEAATIPEAIAETTEAVTYSAPDAGERIGLAEAEGRVVHRNPEARH